MHEVHEILKSIECECYNVVKTEEVLEIPLRSLFVCCETHHPKYLYKDRRLIPLKLKFPVKGNRIRTGMMTVRSHSLYLLSTLFHL